jgi:hypothetical protein
MSTPDTPQRSTLRFCKAFFEVEDAVDVRRRLEALGAYPLGATDGRGTGPLVLWWEAGADAGDLAGTPFVVRLFARRMVLEGPTASAVAAGWRYAAEILAGACTPRVAAGDDLGRFLPRPGKRSRDRPETLDREQEDRVLGEFYAAFAERWITTPHPCLGGRTPAEARRDRSLAAALDDVLAALEAIEEARSERGQPCFSVDRIRTALDRY